MRPEDWNALRAPIGCFDRVVVLGGTPSTQGDATRLAEGRPGLVVVGKRQLHGRGRQGRTWDDGLGASLSMSMVVRPTLPAAGLSLAVGLGVIEACEELGAPGLGLKWPNDVVERTNPGAGRKLAGVLIDAVDSLAVIGVGLNVHEPDPNSESTFERPAVSLEKLGVRACRPTVAAAVLAGVSRWVAVPARAVIDRWLEVGTLRGHRCVFRVDGRHVSGLVVDLDRQWRLVLETDEGNRVRIDAAHAHLEQQVWVGGLDSVHDHRY